MQKIKVVIIALFILISTFMNINHYIFAEEEINGEISLDIIEDGQTSNQVDNKEDDKNTYLVESSLLDVINRINDGESLIIFIGPKEDENLKVMIKAYKKVIETRDDIDDDKLIYLASSNNYKNLLNLTNEVRQIEHIEKAFNGEYAIAIFTYNKEINVIYDYQNLNSSFSPRQLAMAELASAYLNDAKVNEVMINEKKSQIRPNKMAKNAIIDEEYEGPYYDEGYIWKYASKSRIQEFTAPVSGTYYIELWGADGDSDSGGLTYGFNASNTRFTTGIGGGSAKVTGYIHLDKGQTIYLALGPRNSMRGSVSYNGGGAGYGQAYGFRAGGGSAGSIYTSIRGNGELINYKNYLDEVLMVAGGGGGAEDFFTSSDTSYYCNDNHCATSYGGNGGNIAGDGSGSGANGKGGLYEFGVGQSYAASDNSSSGAGGGGLYGGTAGHDTNLYLRGGSGGAGTSYINEEFISDGIIHQGENIKWYFDSNTDIAYETNAKASGASIELYTIDQYPLIINYIDINTSEKIIEPHESNHKYGDVYSISSPKVDGYSLVDDKDSIIEGYMPDEVLELNIYYDYPSITIHYKEYETELSLHEDVIEKHKKGEDYNIASPSIDGYVLYDDSMNKISGTMPGENVEISVYYVKEFSPSKHIVAVNDISIDQELSDSGVKLKSGDIVTYEIRWENNKANTVNKVITDTLSDSLSFIEFENTNSNINAAYDESTKTISLNLSIPSKTKGSIRFKVRVNDTSDTSINNWDRKDPYIKYEVIKSSNPQNNSEVSYNQEITYYLTVNNLGLNPISNIVIIDEIPEGTKYLTSNAGEYVVDGNYIRFTIDELQANEVKKLNFKVKVIFKVEDNSSSITINNRALYDNFNDLKNINVDEAVLEKGISTNEILHKIVGPKLTAVKSANPTSTSIVNPNDEITYTIDISNDGSVDSNYLRIIDEIPEGTEYILGSANLSNTNTDANSKYMVTYGENFDIRYESKGSIGSEYKPYYHLENIRLNSISKISTIAIKYPTELSIKYGGLSTIDITNSNDRLILNYGSNGINQTVVASDLEKILFTTDAPLINNSDLTISFKGPDVSDEYISHGTNVDIIFNTKELKYYLRNIDLSKLNDEVSDFTISWSNGLSINGDTSVNHDGWNKKEGQNYLKFTLSQNNSASDISAYLQDLYFTGTYGTRGSIKVDINVNVQNEVFEEHDLSKVPDDGSHRIYKGIRDLGVNADFKATKVYVTTWGHTHAGDYVLKASNDKSNWTNLASFHVNGGGSAQTFEVKNNNTYRYYEVVETRSSGNYSGQWWQYILKGYRVNNKNYSINLSSDIPYEGELVTDEGTYFLTFPTVSTTGLCEYNTSGNYLECKTSALRAENNNLGISKDHAILTFKVKVLNPSIDSQNSTIVNKALYESLSDDFELGSSIKPINETNEVVHIISSLKPEIVASKFSDPVSSTYVGIKQEIDYFIHIKNTTMVNAPYVVVREYLPENVNYVPNAISDNGVYVYNDGKAYVEWVLENIKGNDTKTISYKVKVVDEPDYTKPIESSVLYDLHMTRPESAGFIEEDPDRKTNKTIHYLLQAEEGDGPRVQVTKISDPQSETEVLRKSDITYTLSVQNISNNDKAIAPYILVRDYIPEGTSFKNVEPYVGNEKLTYQYVENNGRPYIEWRIDFLSPNKSLDLKFTVTVDKEATVNSIINEAQYDIFEKEEEIDGNNLGNKTNQIVHNLINPSISASKSANPESGSLVPHGERITYTINVTNTSDKAIANYVNVEDFIPEATKFIENSIVKSKSSDSGSLSIDQKSIQFVLYDLKPQETRTLSFDVEVKDSVGDGELIKNYALVDTSITENGKPGEESFVHPLNKTNEVIHTLELNVNTIATGGEGWTKIITTTAISFVILAILFMIYYQKEIKH